MATFQLNKLVRDKFVSMYFELDQTPKYRILELKEHHRELIRKILEESSELSNVRTGELAEEIADIEQALDDLKAISGINQSDIERIKVKKYAQKGGFREGGVH